MEQRIQKAVEKYVAGLTKEIVAVIYDDLIDDLQTQRANNKGLERKANGKAKRRNGKTTPVKRKSAKSPSAKKAQPTKRTPKQIEKIATRALSAITKNPGQGIESLAKALRLKTKALSLPIRKLVSDKAIRTKGERRATKYFPKVARKEAAKKAATKKK